MLLFLEFLDLHVYSMFSVGVKWLPLAESLRDLHMHYTFLPNNQTEPLQSAPNYFQVLGEVKCEFVEDLVLFPRGPIR